MPRTGDNTYIALKTDEVLRLALKVQAEQGYAEARGATNKGQEEKRIKR